MTRERAAGDVLRAAFALAVAEVRDPVRSGTRAHARRRRDTLIRKARVEQRWDDAEIARLAELSVARVRVILAAAERRREGE